MSAKPFWEAKSLDAMTNAEWESLCDGCGQCCLHKLVNEETADVFYTRVACQLLDDESGRCKSYATRFEEVEDCLDVRRMSAAELKWMPRSCAYRRLAEKKSLPRWHPLITGTRDRPPVPAWSSPAERSARPPPTLISWRPRSSSG